MHSRPPCGGGQGWGVALRSPQRPVDGFRGLARPPSLILPHNGGGDPLCPIAPRDAASWLEFKHGSVKWSAAEARTADRTSGTAHAPSAALPFACSRRDAARLEGAAGARSLAGRAAGAALVDRQQRRLLAEPRRLLARWLRLARAGSGPQQLSAVQGPAGRHRPPLHSRGGQRPEPDAAPAVARLAGLDRRVPEGSADADGPGAFRRRSGRRLHRRRAVAPRLCVVFRPGSEALRRRRRSPNCSPA